MAACCPDCCVPFTKKKNRVRLSIRAKLLFKEKAGEPSSGFFSTKRSYTDTSRAQATSSAVLDVITRCHSRRKEAITNRGEKPVKKHWLSSHKTTKSLSLRNAPGLQVEPFLSPSWCCGMKNPSTAAEELNGCPVPEVCSSFCSFLTTGSISGDPSVLPAGQR